MTEVRIGLGCMRLSTERDRDEAVGEATIAAAIAEGIRIFDTAHAYGLDERDLGHNERLLGRVLRAHDAGVTAGVRVITKGGMTRPDGRWIPDGRARSLREDCEASLEALGGVPIDVYLLHAPDPRTPWSTSVRGLAALVDAGLVPRVGLSNVNRRLLDEALAITPIAAVEVAIGPKDDEALRGGVVERCIERGIRVIAHTPLGGPWRAARLDADETLARAVERRRAAGETVTAAQMFLAWLLSLDPSITPIPGARRPETVRSIAAAARIVLDDDERTRLAGRFGSVRRAAGRSGAGEGEGTGAGEDREVVMVMGLQGAGKTTTVSTYTARGYERLNRDERGGTLRGLAGVLDARLRAGATRAILDNTYVTRAQRREVIDVASGHGVPVRGIWIDVPLAQAQINVVLRMLDVAGRLPSPEEIARARHPAILPPQAQLRTARELEPPSPDEGFASLEVVSFVRAPREGRAGRMISLDAALPFDPARWGDDPAEPRLVFGWRPGADGAAVAAIDRDLRAQVGLPFELAVCPHPAGPPRCWCRPPLPGLPLVFARAHGVDPARSLLVGSSPAHRRLANALGARYISA